MFSVDDALRLKSYTTTQRDALTSVAGDTIYNSTTNKVQFYNGSDWNDLGNSAVELSYLVVAGGGGGGLFANNAPGAGAAGPGGGGGPGKYNNWRLLAVELEQLTLEVEEQVILQQEQVVQE